MGLGRANADAECVSDFLVTSAFDRELHDFPLARSKPFAGLRPVGLVFGATEEVREQHRRNLFRNKRLVLGKRLDRIDEKLVSFGLEDEALHASLECVLDHFIALMRGEDEDLRFSAILDVRSEYCISYRVARRALFKHSPLLCARVWVSRFYGLIDPGLPHRRRERVCRSQHAPISSLCSPAFASCP
jgi:hypothetical protein